MKAKALLKHNIDTLLKARHQQRQDLAQWCRRSPAWLTQILTKPEREFPTKYLDRVADFFGIAVYQLFQPGISQLTERRKATERRSGQDRRISKALQLESVPPVAPTPDEWKLIRLRRGLTAEEQARLDRAGEVLRLTSGVEARTPSLAAHAKGARQAARGPRRVRAPAVSPKDAADDAAG
jgi:hypothetical protein